MTLDSRVFAYPEQGAMTVLIAVLVNGRGQFTVSPFPQGINDEQGGWIVSWPKKLAERAVAPPEPEPTGTDPERAVA